MTLAEFAAEGTRTLAAIRRRCVDCSGGSLIEPRNCKLTGCDLWQFRLGKNPNRQGKGYFAQKVLIHGPVQPHEPSGAPGAHPEIREPETARERGNEHRRWPGRPFAKGRRPTVQ